MSHSSDTDNSSLLTCSICKKTVQTKQKFIKCNICNYNVHLKCNKIDLKTYEKMQLNDETIFCLKCNEEILPFFPSSEINTNNLCTDKKLTLFSNTIKSFFKGINELHDNQSNDDDDDDDDDDISPINCKYVDIDSFTHKKSHLDFSLFHLNIASLTLHKEELDTILSMLDYEFDVIGITETKLMKDKIPKVNVTMNDYNIFDTPTETEKGGVILYVNKKLTCKPRKDLDTLLYKTGELESVFVEINTTNNMNIICGTIYRHPSMNLGEFNQNFLNPFMEKLTNEKKRLFLLGDFNADLLNCDTNVDITNFFDTLTSNLLIPHIILPTRITLTSKTLIDNIFSNSLNFQNGISGNLTVSISDHLAQFLIISESKEYKPKRKITYKRDTSKFDRENFILDLYDIDLKSVINIESKDPNICFASLEFNINKIIEKHMPLKKISKKENKQNCKPWISAEIRKAISTREKLYKKFIRAKDKVKKDSFFQQYKELRNNIVSIIRKSKSQYFKHFFNENARNAKKTWRGIKAIININNSSRFHPSSLIVENENDQEKEEISSDPKIIANTFNKYFSNIAHKLQGKIYHNTHDFTKYLKNRNESSFFITPTDEREIINIINTFDINKATGPHSIPSNILDLIKYIIAEPLALIINLSFETGIFIENLKIAKTIPIYKDAGNKLNCCNYRPISLLSNINKIIEKLMYNRLHNFLLKYNCIYDLQFGFRKGHSTIHALLHLTEDIRKTLDNNSFAVGIFVDLQKAFDTVDHNILLRKLEFYGIRGLANKWFKSYLNKRKQFVSIDEIYSDEAIMHYGVPQGSVLGPLLFLIYINDLHRAIEFSTTRHFADDTNLLIKNKSLKQLKKRLNYDLRNLCNWLKSNKISLNASKTKLIIFRHPNKNINYDLKVKIDGKKLLPSKYVKYLGVLIDQHLSWSNHIDKIAGKLSRSVGMLSKIRHYVNEPTLRMIYYGIFSSTLTYAAQVWGQIQNKHVNRVVKLQDRAIRIINFANYCQSRNPLYFGSNILKFSDNIKLQIFLYVYDSIKGNLPSALNYNFNFVNELHDHYTRISPLNQVVLPKPRTQIYGIMSVGFQSGFFWNNTMQSHSNINFLDETKSFCKKFVTNHLLQSYNNSSD